MAVLASATAVLAGPGASADSGSVPTKQEHSVSAEALSKKTDNRVQNITQAAWHWDEVLGRPHVRFSYPNGCRASLDCLQWVLKHRQTVSHRLHAKAKRLMARRTKGFLVDIKRYQEELGLPGATRGLAEAEGIEGLFNQSRRLKNQLAKKWQGSWLYKSFLCIHRGEGSMTSVSKSNPPYYGGWQQDITFQKKYGLRFYNRWGTADHWPAWAQLYTAVKAYRAGRGFYPWPHTAHVCGLI